MNETTALERTKRELPQPLPKLTDQAIDELVGSIQQFEKFKQRALTPKDYMIMGDNQYIEKSGWTKLRLATNTSFQIVGDARKEIAHDSEGEYYVWIARGRVTAINGVFVEMDGACSSRDEFFSMADGQRRPSSEIDEKDIFATAETNCFNRCMSFLYGFGELSGEEMRGHEFEKKAVRFPFPDEVKGKSPAECDLATLKKYLPTFEKVANDPKNKWAEQNKKLVAAIQESIAEKTAKVESPAAPLTQPVKDDGKESPSSPAGDVPEKEQCLIRINEHLEAKTITRPQLNIFLHKNWKQTDGMELEKALNSLELLQLQTILAWISTQKGTQG